MRGGLESAGCIGISNTRQREWGGADFQRTVRPPSSLATWQAIPRAAAPQHSSRRAHAAISRRRSQQRQVAARAAGAPCPGAVRLLAIAGLRRRESTPEHGAWLKASRRTIISVVPNELARLLAGLLRGGPLQRAVFRRRSNACSYGDPPPPPVAPAAALNCISAPSGACWLRSSRAGVPVIWRCPAPGPTWMPAARAPPLTRATAAPGSGQAQSAMAHAFAALLLHISAWRVS